MKYLNAKQLGITKDEREALIKVKRFLKTLEQPKDLRPSESAKTDRVGYPCGGNSRQRRFARRHPQHFTKVVA